MIFTELKLKGAYIIKPEPLSDNRGFFARTFCRKEFARYGLNRFIAQCSISFNKYRGTLRGIHYQINPYSESKTVYCIKGAIYDVIVDLRKTSATFLQWEAVELSTLSILFIPEGFAHGFQTLQDNTEILYQISEFYHPECARGIRWDDPQLSIPWPLEHKIISVQDQALPILGDHK